MSDPWSYLLSRYGDEVSAPSVEQVRTAISELYHENIPGVAEGDYEEHGAASLRYGYDDGPMYVLEVTRHGVARWGEWADQDYNDEICPAKELRYITEAQANELWNALAAGSIDLVRAAFNTST